MITETERRIWEWIEAWCEHTAARVHEHQIAAFLLYFVASLGVRCTTEVQADLGLTAWPFSEYFRVELLKIMPCSPGDLLRDLINGFFGMLFLTISPACAFWTFRFGYPLLLWAGLAWPVHRLGLQLTPWPNVDLLLWPALAAAAQAFAVNRVLFALEHCGFHGLAYRIRHGATAAPFVGVALVMGTQLFVIFACFAGAWAQIFLQWLFTR